MTGDTILYIDTDLDQMTMASKASQVVVVNTFSLSVEDISLHSEGSLCQEETNWQLDPTYQEYSAALHCTELYCTTLNFTALH